MKLLLISGLSGGNADAIINPILDTGIVEKILWIHDDLYKPIESLEVFTVPKALKKKRSHRETHYKLKKNSIPKMLYKLVLGARILCRRKPHCVVSVLIYPHGILGFLLSKLFRKPWIHVIIAGQRETHLFGPYWGTIFARMMANATIVTVTGTNTLEFLVKHNVSRKNIVILPNTIEMKNFQTKAGPKKYEIIVITRFDHIKRIDRLIEIVALVKEHHSEVSACVVGDGPEQESLKKLVVEKKLQDNITFKGKIPHNEVPNIWNMGKIFVLTSDGEGMPLTLLEAMGSGVVGIAPDIGDIDNVIKDHENGILIKDPTDIQTYAKSVVELMENKEFYQELAKNALKVREDFDIESATRVWRDILEPVKN